MEREYGEKIKEMESEERERFAAYRLHRTAGIGRKTMWKLREMTESALEIWQLDYRSLEEMIGRKQSESIRREKEKDREKEWKRLKEKGIFFTSCFDADFPNRLRNLPDAPAFLYGKGRLPEEDRPAAAIIGARECSHYGRYAAAEYGAALAKAGIVVVSGMARGVDGLSQWAALENGGFSAGVLGCGVDCCYPPENRALYDRLLKEGCVLSEYDPGVTAESRLFPARNRIISGLADAVLIMEARERSGTQITVEMALEQGREIFALPGRMTDPLSRGCNSLIGQGAGIALPPDEMAEEIRRIAACGECGLGGKKLENRKKAVMEVRREEEKMPDFGILNGILDINPKSLPQILTETEGAGTTVQEITGQLMELVLEGFVICEHGCYRLSMKKFLQRQKI